MEPSTQSDDDQVVAAQNQRDRNLQSYITTLAWALSFAIYVFLALFVPILESDGTPPDWATTKTWGQFVYELRVGFGNALVTFFMFTVIYDVIKHIGGESTERALISALSGSPRIIGMLSVGEKTRHLKQTLTALLGKEFGTALYGDMIEPVLTSGGEFRSNYKYNVTMLEISDYPDLSSFVTLSDLLAPDNYHWVREQIDYQAHNTDSGVFWGKFTIALAFDKDSLQNLYIDPKAYFRSLIELNPESQMAFFAQPATEIERFLKEVMKFRLSETATGQSVNFEVSIDRSLTGSPMLTITTAVLDSRAANNKLRIDFIYPHQKNATHFTYSMPQPCKDPYMAFAGCSHIENLEMIDYFSKVPQDRRRVVRRGADAHPTGYEVEIGGWVFPMSGVTFTWRNR